MTKVIKTGHARLLYRELDIQELARWFDDLRALDDLLMHHPRLFSATAHAYLYFFSWAEQSPTVWMAREVIGFESRLPHGFSFYDTYAGEAYDHAVGGDYWQEGTSLMLDHAREIGESFVEGSIVATWRVKIHNIDDVMRSSNQQILPKISFQFFKSP